MTTKGRTDVRYSATNDKATGEMAVSVACYVDADGDVSLRSIELVNIGQRIRFSYSGQRNLSEILEPSVQAAFQGLLDRAKYTLGVLALPEYSMKSKGLVLEDVRIMVSVGRDAGKHVIMRFRRFFGDIFALFQPKAVPVKGPMDQVNSLAVEALDEVFVPLANLRVYLSNKLFHATEEERSHAIAALQEAMERVEDLEIKYSAVKRYASKTPETLVRHTPNVLAKIASGG